MAQTSSKPSPFFPETSTTSELSPNFANPPSQKVNTYQSFGEMGTRSLYGGEHVNTFESGSRRTNGEVGTGLNEASTAPPACKLPVGSKVFIRNMVASPHRGKVGIVQGWSVARSRYWVFLKDQGTVVETLPGDLMQLLDNVQISGVLDRPELNGSSGTIQGFDEMKRAYIIRLRNQSVVTIPPYNVVLKMGTRIALLAAEQAVGHQAQITKVESDLKLYQLRTKDGVVMRVRYDEVIC